MPSSSTDTIADNPHTTTRYCDYCRLLLSIVVATVLAIALLDNIIISTSVIAVLVIAYGLLAFAVSYRLHSVSSLATLIISEGLVMGLAISALAYSPWPSLLLIALLYFNALYQGATKHWLLINLGLALGIAIGFFILGYTHIVLSSPPVTNAIISMGALAYLSIYAVCSRQQKDQLTIQQDELLNEIKEHKLQAYEISRFLPKAIWEQIQHKRKPKIERKPITIFFSDIVGFSGLSEQLEAETLSNVLSSYLAEMSKIVEQYNGTIDKFIGDAIMVTFGDNDSTSKGVKQDAIDCVSMAIAMGKRMRELQPTWEEMGISQTLQIRIGINSGFCTVGTFGISHHLDRTALGVHVNLASRLESAGQPEEILISHETWNLIKDIVLCKDKGKIKAKGFTHPVQVYKVINFRKELGSNQSYFSQNADGFSIHLDMEKIKNYNKDKILASLELATKKLKQRFPNKDN